MKPTRTLFVSALFVLVALGVAASRYSRLPALVPIHWSLSGHANGFAPRPWGAAMPAIVIAVLALLTVGLPTLLPRSFAHQATALAFERMMLLVQAVVLVVGSAGLLAAAGYPLSVPSVVFTGFGVLLMLLGHEMGKLRRNFFIGIRTPWTMASDAVWERTHRFGAWLFVLSGLVLVVGSLAGHGRLLAPWAFLAAFLLPVVYSFVIRRRG